MRSSVAQTCLVWSSSETFPLFRGEMSHLLLRRWRAETDVSSALEPLPRREDDATLVGVRPRVRSRFGLGEIRQSRLEGWIVVRQFFRRVLHQFTQLSKIRWFVRIGDAAQKGLDGVSGLAGKSEACSLKTRLSRERSNASSARSSTGSGMCPKFIPPLAGDWQDECVARPELIFRRKQATVLTPSPEDASSWRSVSGLRSSPFMLSPVCRTIPARPPRREVDWSSRRASRRRGKTPRSCIPRPWEGAGRRRRASGPSRSLQPGRHASKLGHRVRLVGPRG